MITLQNDGQIPFPDGPSWVADVALFASECLHGLAQKSERGAAEEVLKWLDASEDATWLSHCYSPQMFSWITDAEKCKTLMPSDWETLRQEIEFDQSPEYFNKSSVAVWQNPVQRFLNRLQAIGQGSRSVSSQDAVFLSSDDPLFRLSVNGMQEAVELIRTHVPGYFSDFQCFVRGIILVDYRASFRGASGLNQCGLIFYSPEEEWSPLKWAEELVHESTHYIIHSLDLRQHLVCGENALIEEHPGPFRPDLRHHHGNFHALSVVSRLVVMFDRLASAGIAADELAEKSADYIRRCRPAYEAMLKSGTLSPLGMDIFEQMIQPMFYTRKCHE